MRLGLLGFVAAVAAVSLAGSTKAGSVPHWNHWLCFPGAPNDWCLFDLTTDVFLANGKHETVSVSIPANPPIDCFYVYPSVDEQRRGNAELIVTLQEQAIAIAQAARFSHVCRVYAPLYRQVTAYGNGNPYHGDYSLEYEDVLAAWRDYITHDNHGRGVVLIGHSEGAFLLKRLIREQIEGTTEQKQLVSEILLGGDVVVADGSTGGGDFKSVPACTSADETGCVVAYSSFGATPPKDAMFESVEHPSAQHVLCVNPSAPAGGPASLTPVVANIDPAGIVPYLSKWVSYHWVEFPGLYTARCVTQGSRSWLLVTRTHIPGDQRPTVRRLRPPSWGLHPSDVNIALANLVDLVGSEERAWLEHH